MPRKTKEVRRSSGLPSKDEILTFVQNSGQKPGKREIARAFALKGGDRIALKTLPCVAIGWVLCVPVSPRGPHPGGSNKRSKVARL